MYGEGVDLFSKAPAQWLINKETFFQFKYQKTHNSSDLTDKRFKLLDKQSLFFKKITNFRLSLPSSHFLFYLEMEMKYFFIFLCIKKVRKIHSPSRKCILENAVEIRRKRLLSNEISRINIKFSLDI